MEKIPLVWRLEIFVRAFISLKSCFWVYVCDVIFWDLYFPIGDESRILLIGVILLAMFKKKPIEE